MNTEDKRFVYGAGCTFVGPIQKVGRLEGLPCCPYCGGMLFEEESKEEWDSKVIEHEQKGHEGYAKFIEWVGNLPICVPLEGGFKVIQSRYNFINKTNYDFVS